MIRWILHFDRYNLPLEPKTDEEDKEIGSALYSGLGFVNMPGSPQGEVLVNLSAVNCAFRQEIDAEAEKLALAQLAASKAAEAAKAAKAADAQIDANSAVA